jgi:hypothetical protein
LKVYVQQKRTAKVREKVEQRSPFIPYVPSGKWLPPKETVRQPKKFTLTREVQNAIMSDGKILKKPTITELATTAKKINVSIKNKITKDGESKSRKKILHEANTAVVEQTNVKSDDSLIFEPLNSTYEIESPEKENNTCDIIILESPQIISETPHPKPKVIEIVNDSTKAPSPQKQKEEVVAKKVERKREVKPAVVKTRAVVVQPNIKVNTSSVNNAKLNRNAKVVVPVKRSARTQKPAVETEDNKSNKVTQKKTAIKQSKKKDTHSSTSSTTESCKEQQQQQQQHSKGQSRVFFFYKSCMENQIAYLKMQTDDLKSNIDVYGEKLSEDTRILFQKTFEEGSAIINNKLKAFEVFLNNYENKIPHDNNRLITDDDVENYWDILYEQIEKLKENLEVCRVERLAAIKEKKRRTRAAVDSTPSRRSRRIAECGDAPR